MQSHSPVGVAQLWIVRRITHRMKYSTALKRSRGSVRFLVVVVPIMWGLFIWLRWWQLAAIAGFMSFYLAMDFLNIRRITKAAAKDPEYLKKKIPGT